MAIPTTQPLASSTTKNPLDLLTAVAAHPHSTKNEELPINSVSGNTLLYDRALVGQQQPSVAAERTGSSPSTNESPPLKTPTVPPEHYVQPAYFYPTDSTANSSWEIERLDGLYVTPEEDEWAERGIPVFEPTMDEFRDFEGYMQKVDHWGRRSGIVKVVPPKEWVDLLPTIPASTLSKLRIKNSIQQNMTGRTGTFRQQNIEKKKVFTVKEWFDKTQLAQFASPSIETLPDRSDRPLPTKKTPKPQKNPHRKKQLLEGLIQPQAFPTGEGEAKMEVGEQESVPLSGEGRKTMKEEDDEKGDFLNNKNEVGSTSSSQGPPPSTTAQPKLTTTSPTKYTKKVENPDEPETAAFYASLSVSPSLPYFPPGKTSADYTPLKCHELERKFWRTIGSQVGEPAWYGADMQGSLFTDETKDWNVAKLPNLLNRLFLRKEVPGVNSPYLYWGMWKASFSWHVEDMDLYSINYIHFGQAKCWYAIPQQNAQRFERAMESWFAQDARECDQFLRHKSFAVSPLKLSNESCRPNMLIQHENEFVITFPRGYHAGFNMGFNCAESINFALDSWIEIARKAKACKCVEDSVTLNIDEILKESEQIEADLREKIRRQQDLGLKKSQVGSAKKRPSDVASVSSSSTTLKKPRLSTDSTKAPKAKKVPTTSSAKGLQQQHQQPLQRPCVLCPSPATDKLLPVSAVPPFIASAKPEGFAFMAHEACAWSVPETYFSQVIAADGSLGKVVEGVDAINKDRWNLKCAICVDPTLKKSGAKVQCSHGSCTNSFHVTCAIGSDRIVMENRELERDILAQEADEAKGEAAVYEKQIEHIAYCLCALHNPVQIELRKKDAAAKQESVEREAALGLEANSRVLVRGKGGNYEVTFLQALEASLQLRVIWTDGTHLLIPWRNLILNKPPVQPTPVASAPPVKASHPKKKKLGQSMFHKPALPTLKSSSVEKSSATTNRRAPPSSELVPPTSNSNQTLAAFNAQYGQSRPPQHHQPVHLPQPSYQYPSMQHQQQPFTPDGTAFPYRSQSYPVSYSYVQQPPQYRPHPSPQLSYSNAATGVNNHPHKPTVASMSLRRGCPSPVQPQQQPAIFHAPSLMGTTPFRPSAFSPFNAKPLPTSGAHQQYHQALQSNMENPEVRDRPTSTAYLPPA